MTANAPAVRPASAVDSPNTARLIRPAPAGQAGGRGGHHHRLRLDRLRHPGRTVRLPERRRPLSYLDVAAQVGIIGTSVALLMIAGEFDLSIGSMVGFAGIVIGIGVTTFGHRSGWPSSSRWS